MINPIVLKDFEGCAPKIGGEGTVAFCLWTIESKIYIQISNNSGAGTFNKRNLYSLQTISKLDDSANYVEAYSLQERKFVKDKNTNTKPFLKAIRRVILF